MKQKRAPREKRKSIVRLCVEALLNLRYFGPKHPDKCANHGMPYMDRIYSRRTYECYLNICVRYVKWARYFFGCRTLEQARTYVAVYLRMLIWLGRSAYTIRQRASALAKLYQCHSYDFCVSLPKRCRKNIKQHHRARKYHFCETGKHRMLVEFCKACGLRRMELLQLRPEDVWRNESGVVIVHVIKGKGGRERYVEAINDIPLLMAQEAVAAGQEKIFPKLPSNAPIHRYRQDFALAVYTKYARNIQSLPREEQYHCAAEMRGIIYDRMALLQSSLQLGHNRADVIITYLKGHDGV